MFLISDIFPCLLRCGDVKFCRQGIRFDITNQYGNVYLIICACFSTFSLTLSMLLLAPCRWRSFWTTPTGISPVIHIQWYFKSPRGWRRLMLLYGSLPKSRNSRLLINEQSRRPSYGWSSVAPSFLMIGLLTELSCLPSSPSSAKSMIYFQFMHLNFSRLKFCSITAMAAYIRIYPRLQGVLFKLCYRSPLKPCYRVRLWSCSGGLLNPFYVSLLKSCYGCLLKPCYGGFLKPC